MIDDTELGRGKIVARYVDGKLVKGYSHDFHPRRSVFHVFPAADASLEPIRVVTKDLKAVFWVRDFVGNPQYQERKQFVEGQPVRGRRVAVTFSDGEVLVGSAEDAQPEDLGFYLVPADPRCNNLRLFAVSTAVRGIRRLSESPAALRGPRPGRPGRHPERREPLPLSVPRRLLAWLSRREEEWRRRGEPT